MWTLGNGPAAKKNPMFYFGVRVDECFLLIYYYYIHYITYKISGFSAFFDDDILCIDTAITAIMSANTVAEIPDKILTCSCISLKFLVTLTECGCPLAMLRW